ncbi:hypothetical protein BGZ59_009134 [Podila verticillata]|nr:hypothetical protein BGZ59_009134 [Podila verticillata]
MPQKLNIEGAAHAPREEGEKAGTHAEEAVHHLSQPIQNGIQWRDSHADAMQQPDILERHPRLAELLTSLNSGILAPTGLSLDLHQKLTQARQTLKYKQQYLESTAIYEPLERLRFLAPNSRTPLQTQVSIHIDRIISLLETRRLLLDKYRDPSTGHDLKNSLLRTTRILSPRDPSDSDIDPEEDDSDINPEHDLNKFTLDQLQPHVQALSETRDSILQTIQHSIRQREADVLDFYNATFPPPTSGDSHMGGHHHHAQTRLSGMIAQVRELQDTTRQANEATAVQESALVHKVAVLFDTLNQSITVLWQIVLEFKMKHRLEQDTVFREYYAQLVQCMALKLKLLKISVTSFVYDSETVRVFAEASDNLREQGMQLQQKTQENAILLQKFQTAGKDFHMIVEAYANVMERIKVVQDDIRRLK